MDQRWPGNKRVAVAVTIMFETWSEGKGPSYSVQTTHLKPGTKDWSAMTWGQYGGNVGVWRILRALERRGVRATFAANARSTEVYRDAARTIVAQGHDIAGHGYTQDQLLVDLEPDEQRAAIRRTLDVIEAQSGLRPSGWISPVLAWNEHTAGFLVDEGLVWQGDANYIDLPTITEVRGKKLVTIPFSDYTDNRVLRASPPDFFNVYKSTFDYLYENEPFSLLVVAAHCQWGGRAMMSAIFDQLLGYLGSFSDVAFTTQSEIARWVLEGKVATPSYAERYFAAR